MTEMQFDVPSFTGNGDNLASTGRDAGSKATNAAASTLGPPGASSPVGAQIAMLTGQLQGGLSPAGPQLTTRASALGGKTQSAMSAIQSQDSAGASLIRSAAGPGAAVIVLVLVLWSLYSLVVKHAVPLAAALGKRHLDQIDELI
jgi:hypothetical protein